MNNKIIIVAISMFFSLFILYTASAYTAYISIYIVDFDTNTDDESDPIEFVDHANSPVEWQVNGSGCDEDNGTWYDDIPVGEYGAGDTIVTGRATNLTAGNACNLFLRFDEVKVGSNYYGKCATDNSQAGCTTCTNVGASCRVKYTSYGTPTNGYTHYEASSSAGNTANCAVHIDFGRCSDEVQDQLDVAGTSEFKFTFTA